MIDNGRAINTFTPDVATNSDVYLQGRHYGVPGVVVNGQSLVDTLRTGRAVTDYVRANGPAIMQVCTIHCAYTTYTIHYTCTTSTHYKQMCDSRHCSSICLQSAL